MKVIILQNIKELGQMGDVKQVKDGYARNFLIPNKLAIFANKENLSQIEALKKKRQEALSQEKQIMQAVAQKLNDLKLEIQAKADAKGTLYASIGEQEIIEQLKKSGIDLTPDFIRLSGPIKKLGDYKVSFEYDSDVKTEFSVIVSA